MSAGAAAALDGDELAHDLVGVGGEPVEDRLGDGLLRAVGSGAGGAGETARGLEHDAGIGVLGEAGQHTEGLGQVGGDAADRRSGLAPDALRGIAAGQLVERAEVAVRLAARRAAGGRLTHDGPLVAEQRGDFGLAVCRVVCRGAASALLVHATGYTCARPLCQGWRSGRRYWRGPAKSARRRGDVLGSGD